MKNLRLWSKKIVKVLSYYSNNPNDFLFALTRDIDNLGIFVANNGRPLAENLVDVYNHLIGIFLYDFTKKHPEIKIFHLVPSGEEVFAIGVCESKEVIKEFFQYIESGINLWIKDNTPETIFDKDVTISFGKAILNDKIDIEKIKKLSILIEKKDNIVTTSVYLSIMQKIREILSYQLRTLCDYIHQR